MARSRSRLLSTLVAVPVSLGLVLAMGQPVLAQPPAEPDGGTGNGSGAAGGDPSAGGADLFEVEPLPASDTGLYVVRLDEPALAAYDGGVAGLAPTSPRATGAQRLDVEAPASVAYLEHLSAAQDTFTDRMERVLDRPVDVAYQYLNVLNGLAVAVDPAEAARLATLPGVAGVYPDLERELTTDVSHDVIGSAGFWEGETGPGVGTRGEGVVVGMIDTGVNGNHPSFAAVDGEGYAHDNPLGSGNYLGVCDPEHPAHEDICNDKLIGAYNFHPDSPSAQDANNHGSHVGSTIAGNVHDATFTVGQDTYTRTVQGVAPRANVVSFLVCFPGCPPTSSVAAVNQAIADGVVDVLNFSISGADDPWNDPVDLAFLDAFEAGIYVSASAGNDGPGPSTVAKTGPWNASVAASTHGRVIGHTLDVLAPEPVPAELTDLIAFPSSDGIQLGAELVGELRFVEANPTGCEPYPAGAFDGALALIQRGGCTFPVKVDNAAEAGATAVVFYNNVAGPPTPPGGLADAELFAVMLEQAAGLAVRDAVLGAAEPVEVRIGLDTELVFDPERWQDIVAGFSSRGPSQHDLLAPTFTAPGVNILAAARQTAAGADNYTVLSGTSMAAPHGAGAAALLIALHPDWSPAQVRSALAGTADPDVLRMEDGASPAGPFDQGSGRIDLSAAARVGLVLDETHENFVAANPATGDPRTLNVPHFVDGNCVATCSWTRTVASVADTTVAYSAVVQAPPGLTVTVSPSTFTIAPGDTQSVTVTVAASALSAGEWEVADVRLATTGAHANGVRVAPVHFPVAVTVQPPALELDPTEISAAQAPGEVTTEILTLSNTGGEPLSWELVELAPATAGTTAGATAGAAGGAGGGVTQASAPASGALGTIPLWNQPIAGNGGIISDFYNAIGTGVYVADDFVVPGEVEIEMIHADGFWNAGNLTDATALNWYIYPDAGGRPAGQPEDGRDSHLWTYTSPPSGPGLTLANDDIALDVVAATGQTLTLPAGTYWLSVFPDIDSPCCAGDTRWNWRQGTEQLSQAHLVDPSNLFGSGFTDWTPLRTVGLAWSATAFRLEGTIDCTAGDIPWLEVSPASGTVAPLTSEAVTVSLDSTGLPAGEHHGTLCLVSNDPAQQVVIVPVTLVVEEPEQAPVIEVAPASLASEQAAGTVTEHPLTIANTGEDTLDWQVVAAGGEAAVAAPADAPGAPAPGSAMIGAVTGAIAAISGAPLSATDTSAAGGTASAAPRAAGSPLAATVLWHQPPSVGSGIVSDYYRALGGGIYAADEFVLDGPAAVELIHADGFWTDGSLAEATAINWYIYPDSGGVPAGHPEDGRDSDVWRHRSTPGGAGVDTAGDNITLDVVAATGAGVVLPPGTYWLTVFPDIDSPTLAGATRWNWNGAAQQGAQAHLVDPTNLFGANATAWTPFSLLGLAYSGTAFRLEGTQFAAGCMPSDLPWLRVTPASGSTPAGGSSEVSVSLDATGLPVGEHTAVLCVSSNDPATPVVQVPVSLTVVDEPAPACDRTITGLHAGPLAVTDGVTCLVAGAFVQGPVNVHPGAGLTITGAVVQGPISATGAAVVDVSFSQITGPVSVVGSTSAVSLRGSQVIGPVSFVNNRTAAGPAVVAANTIIGGLTCTGNEPPPANLGAPNTVVGPQAGQCAGL